MIGYMVDIAVLMIEGQIDQLLGINTAADDLLPDLGRRCKRSNRLRSNVSDPAVVG